MEVKRKHIIYKEEFRRQAVEMVIHSGKTQAQVARELGCSEYSLNLWKKAYLRQQAPAEIDGQQRSPEQMLAEIRRLQKENEYLKTAARDPRKSDEHPGRGTESRYAMIKELSVDFDIKECCEALRVSRSGYYRWGQAEPSRREKETFGASLSALTPCPG